MKILLVEDTGKDRYTTHNKDQMGGFGIDFKTESLISKILQSFKIIRMVPIMMLGYAAGILSKNHDVEVVSNGSMKEADIVIIYSSIVQCKAEREYAIRYKEKYPRARVGFIGPFASKVPEFYKDCCDFIIQGEPESIFFQLNNGEVKLDGLIQSPSLKDIDALPFPKWELFEYNRYNYFPLLKAKPFITMTTTRGCSMNCSYCPYTALNGRYQERSIKNVLDEMEYLQDVCGIKSIMFRDPVFVFNKQRVRSLLKGMAERRFRFEWGCETRMDMLDRPIIEFMVKHGLKAINFGVESGNDEILKNVNRKQSFDNIIKNIEICRELGVKTCAFYLIGTLSETSQTAIQTLETAKRLNTFVAKFHINTPYPGTPQFEELKPLLLDEDWEKYDSSHLVFKHPSFSSADILRLKNRFYNRYYFRLSYLIKNFPSLISISI